jgi:hypothetical protein
MTKVGKLGSLYARKSVLAFPYMNHVKEDWLRGDEPLALVLESHKITSIVLVVSRIAV